MYVFDIECYINYFLAVFYDPDDGRNTRIFEYVQDKNNPNELKAFFKNEQMRKTLFVSFNGLNYDIPIIQAFIHGNSLEDLKKISDEIIKKGKKHWQILKDCPQLELNHIDLKEVAPGHAGLKLYAARMHYPKLQELPIDPESVIEKNQYSVLKEYCLNDCKITYELFNKLKKAIDLRVSLSEQYGVDLRSKSDAQIAENVVLSEIGIKSKKIDHPEKVKFIRPEWMKFKHFDLEILCCQFEEFDFEIDNGKIRLPGFFKEKNNDTVQVFGNHYSTGIGGLHSIEKSRSIKSDKNKILIDRDVASYYPSIILNRDLYPPQLGKKFIDVYRGLVEKRLDAKRIGDKSTADSLKITINGCFGKLNSIYSNIYAPELFINVTVTGQFALLMLIERLGFNGINVISANTDGILIYESRDRYEEINLIIQQWEKDTGFNTEETIYRAFYQKDVNNYIAFTDDGKTKLKGLYSKPGFMKNPTNEICVEAAIEYLKNKSPIEEKIRNCKDITKFVTIRTVNGGAYFNGESIGKICRWYYDGKGRNFEYKNGNRVPKSVNAAPLFDLHFPNDLDYDYYIKETKLIINSFSKLKQIKF